MNNRICITFANRVDMDAFMRHYKGTIWSYYPNYNGQVTTNRHLFMHDDWVELERDKVKNLSLLRQDIDRFHGEIML